jgi:hypothetical protein
MHDVTSGDVFESPEYRAVGGPASTGEWQKEHTNWRRNLYAGVEHTAEVPPDAHLLVCASVPASHAATLTWLESAGLDRSVERRGIAIVPAGRLTARLFDLAGVCLYRPISRRIAG